MSDNFGVLDGLAHTAHCKLREGDIEGSARATARMLRLIITRPGWSAINRCSWTHYFASAEEKNVWVDAVHRRLKVIEIDEAKMPAEQQTGWGP
jgi:hypothetical protein